MKYTVTFHFKNEYREFEETFDSLSSAYSFYDALKDDDGADAILWKGKYPLINFSDDTEPELPF